MRRLLCIIALALAASLPAAAKPPAARPAGGGAQTYKVRLGDTLGAIAKKYHVNAVALATYNKLEKPDDLKEGQILRIPSAAPAASAAATTKPAPSATSTAPATKKVSFTSDYKAALDKFRIIPGKWRYIVVHHSASKLDTPAGMDAYHRNVRHMENGLAYHFVIGGGVRMKDGAIFVGNRWRRQLDGGHLASEALNAKSIGICLIGNFDETQPTPKQLQSLYALIGYLRQRCGLSVNAVKLHREINTRPTECPGKRFPTQALRNNI